MNRTPLAPPVIHPPRWAAPVLLSIPHSGRDYPPWLLAQSLRGRESLSSLEDPLVDRLAWRALGRGFGAVIAATPRAAVDINRSPDEIDPSVVSGIPPLSVSDRARGGLGIVPGRTPRHGRLWRWPIDRAELGRRLAEAHAPYHDAVAAGLARLRANNGLALLLDCHSMPPRRAGAAQIVIGDRRGTAADPLLAAQAARIVRDAGWTVALNDPYAGGHVVERHGRPGQGIHALQIEIDRSCYLGRDLRTPGPGFDRAALLLESLAVGLADFLAPPAAIAAE